MLFILVIVLTRQPRDASRELDALGKPGILQLTWMMGHTPHIAEKLAGNVDDPHADNLLKAGVDIPVHMGEHIKERKRKGQGQGNVLDDIPVLSLSVSEKASTDVKSPGEESERKLEDVV